MVLDVEIKIGVPAVECFFTSEAALGEGGLDDVDGKIRKTSTWGNRRGGKMD